MASLLGWDSWDIRILADWGRDYNLPNAPGAISDGVSEFSTVTVDGAVFRPEEVNYYLYGVWLRISGHTLQWGERKVIGHRVWNEKGTGIPGRIRWMYAGYLSDFSQASTVAIGGATPGKAAYDRPIYFHIGNDQATNLSGTLMPNGTVVPGEDLEQGSQ
jgi:hypothetical protein